MAGAPPVKGPPALGSSKGGHDADGRHVHGLTGPTPSRDFYLCSITAL